MKICHYLLLPAALTLAACAPPGFEEAPALRAYYAKLSTAANDPDINYLEVCDMYGGTYDEARYVTVGFDDDSYYHYKMDRKQDVVELQYFTTAARRSAQHDIDAGRGCITNTGRYLLGRYGFPSIHKQPTSAYVRRELYVSEPFDDEVKSDIKLAAKAAEDAVAQRKKFVPPQITWGGKP